MNATSIWTTGRQRKPRLGGWRRTAMLLLVAGIACPAIAQPIQSVSVPDPSSGPPAGGGGGDSIAPILSSDGRYVLFTSTANNLALTTSNTAFRAASPTRLNVFLRDLVAGTTSLVSARNPALLSLSPNGSSWGWPLSVSADGHFLTYAGTNAQMLVDTNGTYDVYLYDLQTQTKLLVSQSYGFTGAANDASDCPDIRSGWPVCRLPERRHQHCPRH